MLLFTRLLCLHVVFELLKTGVEVDTGRVPELPAALLQPSSSKPQKTKGKTAPEKDGKKSQAKPTRNTGGGSSSGNKDAAEGRQGKGGRRNDSTGKGSQSRAGGSTGRQPNPYQLDAVENFAVQADVGGGLSLSDRCEHDFSIPSSPSLTGFSHVSFTATDILLSSVLPCVTGFTNCSCRTKRGGDGAVGAMVRVEEEVAVEVEVEAAGPAAGVEAAKQEPREVRHSRPSRTQQTHCTAVPLMASGGHSGVCLRQRPPVVPLRWNEPAD